MASSTSAYNSTDDEASHLAKCNAVPMKIEGSEGGLLTKGTPIPSRLVDLASGSSVRFPFNTLVLASRHQPPASKIKFLCGLEEAYSEKIYS